MRSLILSLIIFVSVCQCFPYSSYHVYGGLSNEDLYGYEAPQVIYSQQPVLASQQFALGGFGMMGNKQAPIQTDVSSAKPNYAAPVTNKNYIQQPIIQPHIIEQPIIQEHLIEQPIYRRHIVNQPIIRPIVSQPVIQPKILQSTQVKSRLIEQPVIQPHVIEQTVVQPQLIEQPVQNKPIVQQPVLSTKSSLSSQAILGEEF